MTGQASDLINIACFAVKVAGSPIPDEMHNRTVEIVVDSALHMPDMAVLRYQSHDPADFDGSTFALGSALVISVQPSGGSASAVFTGEIVSLEPEFQRDGAVQWVVRGYDKSHRLHRLRKSRTFADQSDSAVVQAVVSECGLTSDCDSTPVTYKHIWQANQTAMEFLRSRAEASGYYLYFDGDKVCFKKTPQAGAELALTWRENLLSFSPRVSLAGQVNESTVKEWDPATKAVVVGTKTAPTSTDWQGGITGNGGAAAKSAFSVEGKTAIVSHRVASAGQAAQVAQAAYDVRQSEYVQAEGVCIGNPSLKAGTILQVKDVGAKFSGKYRVTSATHTFTVEGGYETAFSIHGLRPDTMIDLLSPPEGCAGTHEAPSFSGLVTGVVTNIKDPDDLCRVKVKYDWLDSALESDWARIVGLGAGPNRGALFLPEVNDEVLIGFEHGDFHTPFVIGGLWNSKDATPKKNSAIGSGSGVVNERIIKSRSGHLIILSDESGKEQIVIRDKTTKNEIVIDSASNSLSVKVDKDITIEGKGKVTIKTTSGDIAIEGKNVNVKATQNLSLEATQNATLKATSNCTVEGTAGATLKNAAAKVALSGPSVNINNGALEVI